MCMDYNFISRELYLYLKLLCEVLYRFTVTSYKVYINIINLLIVYSYFKSQWGAPTWVFQSPSITI